MGFDPPTMTAPRPVALRVRGVTLQVTSGADAGRTARVDQPTFVIGSGEAADLRLTDPGASREHLRLTLTPDGVRLRDAGSKNGTYLGLSRIYDLELAADSVLSIGGTKIALSFLGDPVDLQLSASGSFGAALGESPIMRHLFATLERASASELSILVEGESGVGKELLAHAIHDNSPRRSGPFVVADCSSLPPHLIESELFGHERGAFTGATHARSGLFEEANGGTIFLDEIGELPLDLQPKLLRVLEQGEVRPVGARSPRPISVRVVAATNRRLTEASRTGEFRSDLFYRLAVVRVTVPPLRERPTDILLIARKLLAGLKRDPTAEITPAFAALLTGHTWPGNVRELRNVVERYAALGPEGGKLLVDDIVPGAGPSGDGTMLPYHEARQAMTARFEEAYAKKLLERSKGNMTRAAEIAGISRTLVYRLLDRLDASKE